MTKIAVINQKGGVGKTTTSVNLAYGLAQAGKKTLLIDLDPQAHSSVIYCPEIPKDGTVKELFLDDKKDPRRLICPAMVEGEAVENLSVIPSNIHLARASEQIATRNFREALLEKQLRKIADTFDFVIMDCPPTLGIITVNAVYTADLILIPTTYGRYSLDGISDLFQTISELKDDDSRRFLLLRNAFEARNKQTNTYIDDQLKPYEEKLLETIIRKTESINQAQIVGKPVAAFDPKSKASEDFLSLTHEIINHG